LLVLRSNDGAGYDQRYSLKAEDFSPKIQRRANVIDLPGGTVLILDLGRIAKRFMISGVVDQEITELIGTITAGTFLPGDALTAPSGTTATFVAYHDSAVAGEDKLLVTNISVAGNHTTHTNRFEYNEVVTGAPSGATFQILTLFPSKQDLEDLSHADYDHTITLITTEGTYTGKIGSVSFSQKSPKDWFELSLEFLVISGPV